MKKIFSAVVISAVALFITACFSMKQLWSLEGILVSHDGVYYTGKSAVVVLDSSKGEYDFEFTATSKPADNGYPVRIQTVWQGSSPCLNVGQNGGMTGQYMIHTIKTGYGTVVADCGGYRFTFIVYSIDSRNGITVEKLEAQRQAYLEAEAKRLAEERAAREAAEELRRARRNLNGLWIADDSVESGLWFNSNGKIYSAHPVVASDGNRKWVYSLKETGYVTDELEFTSGIGRFTYENNVLYLLANSGKKIRFTKSRSSASVAKYLATYDQLSIVVPSECVSSSAASFSCTSFSVDEEVEYMWYMDNTYVHAPEKTKCTLWLAEGAHSVYVEASGKSSGVKIRSKVYSLVCRAPQTQQQTQTQQTQNGSTSSNVSSEVVVPESAVPAQSNYSLSSCGGLWINSSDSKNGLYIEPNSGVVYEAFVKYNTTTWVFISSAPVGTMDRSMNYTAIVLGSKVGLSSQTKLTASFLNAAGKNDGGTYTRNGGSAGTANLMRKDSFVSANVSNSNLSTGERVTVSCGQNQFDESVTYQWYVNGSKIDGGISQTISTVLSKSGAYRFYADVTGTKSGYVVRSQEVVVNVK